MGSCIKPNGGLFGPSNKFIKIDSNGNFVSIEGPNTLDKVITRDIKFPFNQELRGRIVLNPGQVNYPFNFLGLGDNCTFFMIRSYYDDGSKIEADNFVQYYYIDNPQFVRSFAQMLVLTGNSENRIPQIFLNNPNQNYPVTLDVMVAIIDNEFSFFQNNPDLITQNTVTFSNLKFTDIITWEPGETIAVLNPAGTAIAYIRINEINSIERNGRIIIIDEVTMGQIILEFIDEYNAIQTFSSISWVLENPTKSLQDLNPRNDSISPVITFTSNVYLEGGPSPSPSPSPSTQLSSADGNSFIADPISLSANGGAISKLLLRAHIVHQILDNRDGIININDTNLIVTDILGNIYSIINKIGDYIIKFNLGDLAENQIDPNLEIKIKIIT